MAIEDTPAQVLDPSHLCSYTPSQNPLLRDRVFYGCLAGAFAHGMYLVFQNIGYRWKFSIELGIIFKFDTLMPEFSFSITFLFRMERHESLYKLQSKLRMLIFIRTDLYDV